MSGTINFSSSKIPNQYKNELHAIVPILKTYHIFNSN